MNPEEACSKCGGRRRIFLDVAESFRMEVDCPACGGTGMAAEQTANVLSGQIAENVEQMKEADLDSVKRRFANFQVQ